MSERLELRYVPLSTLVKWEHNPKLHDLDQITESIKTYGFGDPAKYDATLKALVYGNGRVEALQTMHRNGDQPPVGIAEDDDDWAVPVLFGVDQASVEMAERFALDHNSTTLGPQFSDIDTDRLWDTSAVQRIAKQWSSATQLVVPVSCTKLPDLKPSGDKKKKVDDGTTNKADVMVVVGSYRISVKREVFLDWHEELRLDVGFEVKEIMAEILRRLQLKIEND